jgi:hypothetical protein
MEIGDGVAHFRLLLYFVLSVGVNVTLEWCNSPYDVTVYFNDASSCGRRHVECGGPRFLRCDARASRLRHWST